jgi:hypothetical protein
VTRRLTILGGATLAFAVAIAVVGRALWGDFAVGYTAAAMLLCLIPATVTLVGSTWAASQPADKQLIMRMGGNGLRLAAVLIGFFALVQSHPFFREDHTPGFLIFVGVFYLLTLALETGLSVSGRPGTSADVVPAAGGPTERVG